MMFAMHHIASSIFTTTFLSTLVSLSTWVTAHPEAAVSDVDFPTLEMSMPFSNHSVAFDVLNLQPEIFGRQACEAGHPPCRTLLWFY
jgi:hypothetical protein